MTVVAGSCTNEYQGCPLPSENYRALPWWLVTVVNDTNLKEAHRRKTCKIPVKYSVGHDEWRVQIFSLVCRGDVRDITPYYVRRFRTKMVHP